MRTKNLQLRIKHRSRRRSVPGFTLVEMLVAVALVLLMMSMFAQVFQMAGSTITTQRGIAENDQRSRTVQNIIKGDLDKRTFRLVMPWATGEDGGLADTSAVHREGYFYYSENDPANDLDDLLQFTINVNTRVKNPDTTALFGKATAGTGPSGPSNWGWVNDNGVLQFSNQPEADDGWSTSNGTAESPTAEVAYFVRGGRLYRRMLLIRKPLPLNGAEGQPTFPDRRDAFNINPLNPSWPTPSPIAYGGVNRSTYTGMTFWNDFDFSAFLYDGPDPPLYPYTDTLPYAVFHSSEDLSNGSTVTQFPLGRPQYRFGHRTDTGRPREFDAGGVYFGRFTHEETSNYNFKYPHDVSTVGNPLTVNLNINPTTNVFPDFVGGLRRGEDLLLSNVHSFDVKIWDPGALGGSGAFVNIGQTSPPGAEDPNSPNAVNYAIGNRSNTVYGPVNTASAFAAPYDVNRVFDTWHPDCNIDIDGTSGDDPPPFRHVIYGAGTPNNNEWGRAVGQLPNLAIKQQRTWEANPTNPNAPYAAGDLVFPTSTNRRQDGLRYVYRCVQVVGTPSTARAEPLVNEWPGVAGARFQDGTATNYIVWEAVDNWKPVRAIQITIRFQDITSDQIRQQTIVHALAD